MQITTRADDSGQRKWVDIYEYVPYFHYSCFDVTQLMALKRAKRNLTQQKQSINKALGLLDQMIKQMEE